MAEQAAAALPPRLARVAAQVPAEADVADIGADHGLLTIRLLAAGPGRTVIATELRDAPLGRLRAALDALPASVRARAVLRQGAGLTVLAPGEVAVVVIAGLGGTTMVEMLRARPQVAASLERLVLQPMQGTHPLRRWLVRRGWRLAWEELVQDDGRLYVVMVAEPGRETATDPLQLEVGPRLIERRDPLLAAWIQERIGRYTRVVREMESGLGPGDPRVRRRRRHIGRLKELCDRVNTGG